MLASGKTLKEIAAATAFELKSSGNAGSISSAK